jgi:hypothetical protein
MTVEVHRVREEAEVEDPRLLAALAQADGRQRLVARLAMPAELHPEAALAVERQQGPFAGLVEDEAGRREVGGRSVAPDAVWVRGQVLEVAPPERLLGGGRGRPGDEGRDGAGVEAQDPTVGGPSAR